MTDLTPQKLLATLGDPPPLSLETIKDAVGGIRLKDDELDALIAECLRAREAGEWQPIETAPRDGSEILILAHGMVVQARYEPGCWSDDTPISPAEYDGAVWCAFDDAMQFEIEEGAGENGTDLHGQVTHWRPLPQPPRS